MGGQVMNLLDGNNIPTLDIILLLTIIALLPSIVVMVTSFTRIIIILSFLRNAMGIQQVPPTWYWLVCRCFLPSLLWAQP